MSLSIAIPVYNFAAFLPETLESILSQDGAGDVEVVVTDGASTDNTADLMAEVCARHPNVRYNRLPKKGGIDKDIAYAVEATTGTYVWLFSGDDIMHAGALRAIQDAIRSEDDVYVAKHLECNFKMEVTMEWPVLVPDEPRVFDLSDPAARLDYFKRAVNSEAFFSFCSGLIIKRETWDRGVLDERFIGSCFAHSARLVGLMRDGLTVNYLARALLSRRGENDSFMDRGHVDRWRVQVDGFHDIVEANFARRSPEAREVRRAIRNEISPGVTFYLKRICFSNPETESMETLDKIVARAYRDFSLKCLKARLAYYRLKS